MLEELKDLFESGKYQEVLDQFTQNESQGEWATLPEEERIESIYYKSRSLEWLGRYGEALQTAARARTTYPSPKNPSYLLGLLAAQFYVLFALGRSRLDETQSVLTEGEAIMESLTDEERQTGALWIAVFEQVIGYGYWGKNEFDKAIEYYHKALKSFETLDNRHSIAQCLFWIADNYRMKGEVNTALNYYQRSLTLYESLGNKLGIAHCLHDFGLVSWAKGDLDTALDYYQRSLSLSETSGNSPSIANILMHIGNVYTTRGDFDKALDYFRRSLAIVEPLNLEWAIAYNFYYIGMTYYQKCALDIALPFFQSSLAKFEALKWDYNVVRLLFRLVLLSLDQQEVELAQKYLNKLQKVAAHIPDEAQGAHVRKRIAEALVLKQSPRMTEKARAQTLLREIVNETTFLGSIAMVALCDLLLLELKATGEPVVWEEAKTLIHQFYTRAQDYQEFNMVVNSLLLKAKFATVEGELDHAIKYFNEAKVIVKAKNLSWGGLVDKVETEQKEFETELWKWQDLIQQHASLQERLVQAQLEEYVQEVQKTVQRSPLKRP
ncbi:MAG: tetratricopeptide repeat protein [Candidatus Hodarchaeales archaeon]|jgi:tetratricopeptide (TPR) repeat protein